MKRVAIYARTSTADKQTPEMQLRDLQNYASQRGYVIIKEYVDQMSGSTTKRPALDEMMKAAKEKQFDVVLVWRFDRFARSSKMLVTALADFKEWGVGFVSYSENIDTDSPLGQAIFTIISAMSQLERDVIRDRVKGGLRNAIAKGKRLGRPTRIDVAQVKALRAEGLSLSEIASRLHVTKGAVSKTLSKVKRDTAFPKEMIIQPASTGSCPL